MIKRTLPSCWRAASAVRANPLSYNTAVGVPLAILGRELDTRAPGPLLRGMASALWTAYGSRAPVDVMVLELGVRAPGRHAGPPGACCGPTSPW